jgi:signal transduction histidine kinase/DNA-binding response OmpR family regulator
MDSGTSEKRLVDDLDAMTRLVEVDTLFVREGNLESVLGKIVEAAISISGADFGNIQLLDSKTSHLRIVASRGFPKWWLDFWNNVSAGRGACGTAIQRRERVLIEDILQSPVFIGTEALDVQLKAGVRAVQSTPILSRSGSLLGIFSTHYKAPFCPDDRALQQLDLLARQAADIIERAQAEVELNESEERFRAFTSATSDVVYRMNADWTEMCHLQGRKFIADTLEPSRTWLDKYIPPEDQSRVMTAIRQAIETKRVFELEHRVIRVDGTLGWTCSRAIPILNALGEIVEWFGAAGDVTERKRTEEALTRLNESLEQRVIERTDALRAKEAQASAIAADLQTVIETVPAITFISQDPLCVRMDCNRMAREFLHLSEGLSPSKSAPESERPSYRVWKDGKELPIDELPMQLAAATGSDVRDAELRLTFADGTYKDILGNASPLLDESGKVRGAVGAFIDITERNRAEQQRLEMERCLLHAQKLESIGILAGGIAHDFNNILAGIMGYTELLARSFPSSESARENIDVIKNLVQRAADLTRQMLAYSGRGKFHVEAVNLSSVVESTQKMLEVIVSKKASVTYDLASALPTIHADASQICQVVMNLVINASEALGEQGGVIAISTHSTRGEDEDTVGMAVGHVHPETEYVCLQVSDSGSGMSQETLDRIFDPFFTTKFTGRGLGLAAVHGIVCGHSGAIQVSSKPDNGTIFRVLFPAMGAAMLDAVPSSAATTTKWRGAGQILIVDDEEAIRDFTRKLVEEMGFSVRTARDGEEAIQIYREELDRIDCVLLDLTMPKMNGEETFRELRRIKPDVSVILSSGYSEEGAIAKFSGLGLAGFIQKPYGFDTLAAILRNALSGIGKSSAAEAVRHQACTVLVVDDEAASRDAMQFYLREAGFSTLTAEDGETAVRIYRDHHREIVCVFIDLTLPKKDGVETFRELRRFDDEARIVVMSGRPAAALRERFDGMEVFGFICKPESPDGIVDRLWKVLRTKRR